MYTCPLPWEFSRGWGLCKSSWAALGPQSVPVSVLQKEGSVQAGMSCIAVMDEGLQQNPEAQLGMDIIPGGVGGGVILFSHMFLSWALSAFPGGWVRWMCWAGCTAQVEPWPKPLQGHGATSSVTAERRWNNPPFPPPPFSFQPFHRILWLVAKSCLWGHSAAMSFLAADAQGWLGAEQRLHKGAAGGRFPRAPLAPCWLEWHSRAQHVPLQSPWAHCFTRHSFVGTWRGFISPLLCSSLGCSRKVDLRVQALPHLLDRPVEHAQLIQH